MTALLATFLPSGRAVEGVISAPPVEGRDSLLESLLRVGPFRLHPHLTGNLLYDDNVRISPSGKESDVIFTIAPGLSIGVGDYLSSSGNYAYLDYSPTFLIYTDHGEFSTVDHAVNLSGQYALSKLTFGLAQSYVSSSGGLVEAADRVDREIYLTTLTSHYRLSQKTSFEVNIRQTISSYDQLEVSTYNEWVNQDWVNYRVTQKVTMGAGVTVGLRDLRGGPNEVFEQALLRVGYRLTEKVDVSASAGAEFRQFQGGASDDPAFVFSLGGIYRPRPGTGLSLEAYRQDRNSLVTFAENYTATGIRMGVRQRVMREFEASLSVGFQHSSYRSNGGGASSKRSDDYYYVAPGFDYHINENWDAGVFYQYRENASEDPRFEFSNNQVGIRSSYRF